MAVCMFKLTQGKRKLLSTIFITLSMIQILIGFSMTSTSLYVIVAVSPVLHTEKAEITFVFAITGLYGSHVIFHWIIGFKVCEKCFKQAHKKSTNNLLLLWSCAGTNTVINLLIIAHLARKVNKHIAKSLKQSISIGMNNYLSDIAWKETIDRLQYNNECCGINSHEDWHNKAWLTRYHINTESGTVNQLRPDKHSLALPVTPWSCCKIGYPMQCLHDPLQQEQYLHIWANEPNIVESSINTKGCIEGLKKPVHVVISLFIFFCTAAFVLHLMTFLTARILYTSSRNAILLNDPEGLAPGWIFGRGDCGYTRGKTLDQIMGGTLPTGANETKDKLHSTVVEKKGFRDFFSGRKGRREDTTDQGESSEQDYTLVPLEPADETFHDAQDYSHFTPNIHSSKHNTTMDETGSPMSMEEELKRLQQ